MALAWLLRVPPLLLRVFIESSIDLRVWSSSTKVLDIRLPEFGFRSISGTIPEIYLCILIVFVFSFLRICSPVVLGCKMCREPLLKAEELMTS